MAPRFNVRKTSKHYISLLKDKHLCSNDIGYTLPVCGSVIITKTVFCYNKILPVLDSVYQVKAVTLSLMR